MTADEWLAAHREGMAEDDKHRDITEADIPARELDDRRDERQQVGAGTDRSAPDAAPAHGDASTDDADDADSSDDEPSWPEAEVRDVPDEAADEPEAVAEDITRVPTAAETLDATRQAQRALLEIRDRDNQDARRVEQERAEQLTRWSGDDTAERDRAIEVEQLDDAGDLDGEPVT